MSTIQNGMNVLNDSINKMPTMVTVNQNQPNANGSRSSKESNYNTQSFAEKKPLTGAGQQVLNSTSINRNSQAVSKTQKVPFHSGSRPLNNSISNQNEIDHFIQVDLDSVVQESLIRNKQSGLPKK